MSTERSRYTECAYYTGMFTIGIAGGSGSGKSTLVEQLLRRDLGPHVAHLPHDAYYRNWADMPPSVRSANNWDHPDALDTTLYVAHVDALKAGRAVDRPVYDFAHHARADTVIRVDPRPVLLLEGILLFHLPEVRDRTDLKVYVETPADLRILRRLVRDVRERGRSVESVVEQYHATVRPMHFVFVEPTKAFADVVVPWESHNEPAVSLLAARVREHIPDDDLAGKAV
jgi:uridine kinase